MVEYGPAAYDERVAVPLASRGIRVAGIDASPAMVERLRAKPGRPRLRVPQAPPRRDVLVGGSIRQGLAI